MSSQKTPEISPLFKVNPNVVLSVGWIRDPQLFRSAREECPRKKLRCSSSATGRFLLPGIDQLGGKITSVLVLAKDVLIVNKALHIKAQCHM